MDTPGGCRDGAEAALAAVACLQHGAFHCRQAAGNVGFTAKMRQVRLENGRWETLHQAVYRLAGTPATWHQGLTAACLAAGPVRSPRIGRRGRCGRSTGSARARSR